MEKINQIYQRTPRDIEVVQFGEGNFLRGFVDYMIDVANEKGVMNAGVAIVKPITCGNLDRFHAQDNIYTVSLRGKKDGEPYVENHTITSVQKVVDAYTEYEDFMELARLDTLQFVVSNTTEAGIVYDEKDRFEFNPPATYPGKLTKFLYERYKAFNGATDKGLIILPVELIENNGGKLKQCVLRLVGLWKLEEGFKQWVVDNCVFCATLVDRIITGYPKGDGEAEVIWNSLGYEDQLLDIGEPFALWVIESEKDISKKFPLPKAGLPVIFTKDQKPYRERKVRILNGAHTSTVLAGYLMGKDTVLECMNDTLIRKFMETAVLDEIVPTVPLPHDEAVAFAIDVLERFENPFTKHALLSISLNSVSKWSARILPAFRDQYKLKGKIPKCMTFSFAALLQFYTGTEIKSGALIGHRGSEIYQIRDNADVIAFFAENSKKPAAEYVQAVAVNQNFWGEDLTKYENFAETVINHLDTIKELGVAAAMRRVLY